MQPDTFTLAVNDDNDDGTTAAVDQVYNRFDEYQNRSVYIDENHTLALRNTITLYRSLPKTSGNFRGVAKTAIKLTEDVEVDGVDSTTTNVAPGLIDVSFSIPVGATPAFALELRMRAVALLLDDTIMIPLVDQCMV